LTYLGVFFRRVFVGLVVSNEAIKPTRRRECNKARHSIRRLASEDSDWGWAQGEEDRSGDSVGTFSHCEVVEERNLCC
jgi:hypothetical protein